LDVEMNQPPCNLTGIQQLTKSEGDSAISSFVKLLSFETGEF